MCVCLCVYIYVCMHVCVHVYVHICMYTCVCVQLDFHRNIYSSLNKLEGLYVLWSNVKLNQLFDI